jgi:hypothetical protein
MVRDVYPESGFSPSQIPDTGAKKAPDPGSGFATLVQSQFYQVTFPTKYKASRFFSYRRITRKQSRPNNYLTNMIIFYTYDAN